MEAAVEKPRRPARTAKARAVGSVSKKSGTAVSGQAQNRHQHALSGFARMYLATPAERISLIREGVPAKAFVQTGEEMGLSKERMITLLSFPRATVNRRIKAEQPLPTEYSERIIGLQKLVGQVEVMVAESGDPSGFNAAHWVAEWLERPIAALNNAKPAEFMDTIEGQALVASLLAKMQSGVYA